MIVREAEHMCVEIWEIWEIWKIWEIWGRYGKLLYFLFTFAVDSKLL